MGKRALFILLLLLAFFSLSGISLALNIAVTINPYYLMVKEIVEDKGKLSLIIRPGSDPHSFNPTIKEVKLLSTADLIIANGLNLDNPYLKGYKNVLYLGEKIPKELLEGKEKEVNPHVWLSPDLLVKYILPAIEEAIVSLDKENETLYRKRVKKLMDSLNDVKRKFDELLKGYKGSIVILDHPSYLYLFNNYDIKVLSVEEGHGKQPTPSQIKGIIEEAKRRKLIGIFVGPQFNKSAIETISRELKRNYHILDPIGINAKDIIDLFEEAYRVISGALNER